MNWFSTRDLCPIFILALRITLTSVFIITKIDGQSTEDSQYSSTYTDCCELKLMDSSMQVAIESDRVLPLGRFTILKIRVCTTDIVFVQIWKQINDTAYEFKWQTQFNATNEDTVTAYALVHFDSNPVVISADDRIAVYNPSNSSLKYSIPYEFDRPSLNTMYFSHRRFENAAMFTTGLVIEVEDLRWPRTFSPYLTFCRSLSECPELTSDNPLITTYDPFNGYIPASCCNERVSCDIGNTIKDSLINQNNEVRNLQDTVDVLQKTLQNLLNSQNITGICPPTFTPGVGSCYIVHRESIQMGQAVIRCRDLYSARLLNIQSKIEDNFIKSFLLNSTLADVERFWMSGMYNLELRNWFWYDDDLVTKMPFGDFRNWKDGLELAANTIYDVCSVFSVERTNNVDYWEKATCTDLNYFVCEIPKTCL